MTQHRQPKGAKIAGRSAGGEFATSTHTVPAAPPAGDEVTMEELDAAVNFSQRSAAIRKLWDEPSHASRLEAEQLSFELVRDTISWRYPEADHLLISGFDGDGLKAIAEIRDADDNPLAFSTDIGSLEIGGKDYSNATWFDVADPVLNDALWAHVDGLPTTGTHRIREIHGGVGLSMNAFDVYKMHLDPEFEQKNRAKLEALHEITEDDRAEAYKLIQRERQISDTDLTFSAEELEEYARYAANFRAFTQAYEQGVEHPFDVRQARAWEARYTGAGDPPPGSRAAVSRMLNEAKVLREEVETGLLSPEEIVPGGSQRDAMLALDEDIASLEREMRTQGRSGAWRWFTARQLDLHLIVDEVRQ